MGIDIRDGQQLECITCALCIDACDDVMTRLGKERGLISYATLSDYNRNMALATGTGQVVQPARVRDAVTGKLVDAIKKTDWRSIVHPRTIVYFVGWVAIGLAMLTALALRSPLSLNVLHDRNPLYVELRDGSVRNGYDVKVLNMTPEVREVVLRLEGLPGSTLSLAEGGSETADSLAFTLEPDRVLPVRLYVRVAPEALPPEQANFRIVVADDNAGLVRRVEIHLRSSGEPQMSPSKASKGEFTGRHMWLVVIAVLRHDHRGEHHHGGGRPRPAGPGSVVQNSYVASQEFEDKRLAHLAQLDAGWRSSLSYAGGVAVLLGDRWRPGSRSSSASRCCRSTGRSAAMTTSRWR